MYMICTYVYVGKHENSRITFCSSGFQWSISIRTVHTACGGWRWASCNILKLCSLRLDGCWHKAKLSTKRMPRLWWIARSWSKAETCIYSLDAFVVTPMSKPWICKSHGKDKRQTNAEACEFHLCHSFKRDDSIFVSLFWDHDVRSTPSGRHKKYQKIASGRSRWSTLLDLPICFEPTTRPGSNH